MKNIIFSSIALIIILVSCEKLNPTEPIDKDTSLPVVSFSIKEGKELSGEATLYIKVQDESEIESVSVRLDDSTVLTKTTDYDTIVVDLNYLFELDYDESFQVDMIRSIEVKATDSNGNTGISEPKDVVITQFKGWRIYQDFRNVLHGLDVDDNGLVWYCSNYALFIYDTKNDMLKTISYDGGELPGDFITGFDLIDNSRAWVATRYHITEYDYISNSFNTIELPIEPVSGQIPEITCIKLVDEYLYIGTELSTLNNLEWKYNAFTYEYNNSNFIIYENQAVKSITNMENHPNGSLFIFGLGGVEILQDNTIISNFNTNNYKVSHLVIDLDGIVWAGIPDYWNSIGIYRYENNWKGHDWGNEERYIPLMVNSNGLVYAGVQKLDNGESWSSGDIDLLLFNDDTFIYLSEFDSPFAVYKEYLKYYPYWIWVNYWATDKKYITEAPNGDIWMSVFDRLWRYRPSLGGYPN